MSYTNWAYVGNINYQALEVSPNELYRDDNGFIREKETNAYIIALGTYYNTQQYYNVTLSNNKTYLTKMVDVKADIHTDSTNCYTTADNTIAEVAVYGEFKYSTIGISSVVDIYVTKITEV